MTTDDRTAGPDFSGPDLEDLQLRTLEGFTASRSFDTGRTADNYFWRRKRREVLRLIGRHLGEIVGPSGGAPVDRRFVELGFGDATDFFLIRDRILSRAEPAGQRWSFEGTDGPESLIRFAEMKRRAYGAVDTTFRPLDLSRPLPWPDGTADFVYCSEVVEHLLEPERLLSEIGRILRPGGWLLLTTPNEPNVFQRSFWNRSLHRMHTESSRANPGRFLNPDGTEGFYYGHVSVNPCSHWDRLAARHGLGWVDCGRGAIVYGGTDVHDHELVLGCRLLVEGFLDLLPRRWARPFSKGVVALYRKSAGR